MAGELRLESRVERGPDVYEFRTADGLLSPDEFRTVELSLLEAADPAPGADALVVDANYGVVPTVLSGLTPGGTTVATETSARAARHCEDNLARNGVEARVELVVDVADLAGGDPPATGSRETDRPTASFRGTDRPATDREGIPGGFDLAAYAPRPYDPIPVGTARAVDALAALRPGGRLLLAAEKGSGARRYREALAAAAGEAAVERVGSADGVRVFRAERPPEGGLDRPDPVEERVLSVELAGADCEFVTRPGLFSPASVDRGTELLARTVRERAALSAADRLLDAACGYGPLGIAAAARTGCSAHLSDDSRVATACAAAGAARTGVAGRVAVTTDDCLAGVGGPFDLAVANPPTHAGRGSPTTCSGRPPACSPPTGRSGSSTTRRWATRTASRISSSARRPSSAGRRGTP